MKPSRHSPLPDTCNRCGECCRWLPIIPVRQCKPHQIQYLRERGLKEADGYFLADAPCRHLFEEKPEGCKAGKWLCSIYETRPATCRDFCGKTLSGGKRYYVPACCTMGGNRPLRQGNTANDSDVK